MNITINIKGIKCDGCINRIKNILNNIKEIKTYTITIDGNLHLELKKLKTLDTIKQEITDLGFEIEGK